jgi:hypothetical protein
MSAIDTLADKAQAASRKLAGQGGLKGRLANELADDAAFIRKLKPELIKARATGRRPTDSQPAPPQIEDRPTPPPEPRNEKPKRRGGGPNPFVVVGAALLLGVATAKLIDWRGHVHPR